MLILREVQRYHITTRTEQMNQTTLHNLPVPEIYSFPGSWHQFHPFRFEMISRLTSTVERRIGINIKNMHYITKNKLSIFKIFSQRTCRTRIFLRTTKENLIKIIYIYTVHPKNRRNDRSPGSRDKEEQNININR